MRELRGLQAVDLALTRRSDRLSRNTVSTGVQDCDLKRLTMVSCIVTVAVAVAVYPSCQNEHGVRGAQFRTSVMVTVIFSVIVVVTV